MRQLPSSGNNSAPLILFSRNTVDGNLSVSGSSEFAMVWRQQNLVDEFRKSQTTAACRLTCLRTKGIRQHHSTSILGTFVPSSEAGVPASLCGRLGTSRLLHFNEVSLDSRLTSPAETTIYLDLGYFIIHVPSSQTEICLSFPSWKRTEYLHVFFLFIRVLAAT